MMCMGIANHFIKNWVKDKAWHLHDQTAVVVLCSLFWPITLPFLVSSLIVKLGQRIYLKISSIGSLKEIKETAEKISKGYR